MKVFHCDSCQQTVFYENVACVNCGHLLAYLPEIGDMAALEPAQDDRWTSLAPQNKGAVYKLCGNYANNNVCNWALPADDPNELCQSCRLTRVVPNLEIEGNLDAWKKLETAKRRLVFSLLDLKLPLEDRVQLPESGLAYDFKQDDPAEAGGHVLTGHDNGVITINIAEADDVEREKRRLSLHEPYRTLLGHFRHEVGHYYWDRLIKNSDRLAAFRDVFGDETADYAEALKKHYETGGPQDWQLHFVSNYASSHPWEDWAETWAHYLHMMDSLQTAAACGVAIIPHRSDEPSMAPPQSASVTDQPFDAMIENWASLTYALNNLNRSLGLSDGYPFVLTPAAIEKLRFVHETVKPIAQGEPVPAPHSAGVPMGDQVSAGGSAPMGPVVTAIPPQQMATA